MNTLTPSEFLKLRRGTSLKQSANWEASILGRSISWYGNVEDIKKIGEQILVKVTVGFPAEHEPIHLHFTAPITELEHYLDFSPGAYVAVAGIFTENSHSECQGYELIRYNFILHSIANVAGTWKTRKLKRSLSTTRCNFFDFIGD
jgi:hypothetical protein